MNQAALEQLLGRPMSAAERAAADQAVERAHAEHPELALDGARFFAQVAQGWKGAGELTAELNELHAGDALLACWCAAQDPAAISTFDRLHLARVGQVVRRLDSSGRLGEEVVQVLREKLLVAGPGGRARIADFTGKGGLDAWLRAAAVRTALNLRRAKGDLIEFESDSELVDHVDLRPSPELDLARAASRKVFAATFAEALAGLSARDRAVLKLHYLDGLTTQKIAVVYGTHRVTVTRWLVTCRQTLLEQTRKGLERKLKLDTLELDSLLRLAKASFDVSLKRHLSPKDP